MIPQAVELLAAYRAKTLSPVEATTAALDAIDRHNPAVNAFVLIDRDGALSTARESEKRWHAGCPLGPADGVPTSVKDALWTRGWPTLRGSWLIDAAGPWDEDAPSVARLRESGAVLLGKTTTPEYSWKGVTDSPRYGMTGNPWDPGVTAGGSSGGSAAAVGLGMGAWSVGTDGGGSVRIPAAFTGTVALKPTYGLIPLYPPSPFGTLSHAGPMARTVADVAALMDVVTGFDPRDWSAMPSPASSFRAALGGGVAGLRVAYSPNLGFGVNDPEVDAAVRAAVDVLAAAGAHVEQADPGFADPVAAFHVLWFSGEAKVLQGKLNGPQSRHIDPGLRRTAELGATFTASDYLDATAVRMKLGELMGRFHRTYDVLVTPTLPLTAFPVGRDVPDGSASPDWTSWTPYTYPFNMTQQPALSVPCGFSSSGLPIGLQIVGPRHADALVLRVGQAYQDATDWHHRVPALLTEEVV
ncbi:amidase [Mycolicibacterium mageritense DSM 44476 = CIP 104973]|uniref:amidase n=1 Tax=Mycolicibacterium mageritense TaxID=53462 RepID=A0ABN5YA95_MYCME|nr:amidase [Mycolicibacterium mageritense]MCC9180986.1 amidase [Mycolicibacterium mageritense]BBX35068.1 amidase [Mycolicibacterium mageritense]CDO20418.1 amidase [Mycolicibacterium mageritense DSM 44476 = CIP 104973]